MSNNIINITPQNNTLVIVDNDQNQVIVETPITQIIEVATIGPQGPQGPQGIPGEIPPTSSFVQTGSFNNFTSSFNNFTSSYNTGSFTGSFTGSLLGTASYSNQSLSSSYALTASFVLNAGTTVDTGSLVTTSSFNSFTSSINTYTSSINNSTSSFVRNSQTSSMLSPYLLVSSTSSMLSPYVLNSQTSSFVSTSSFNNFTSSYNTGSFTGSFKGDGSQLTGIVSSKWTGSNPISRLGDVEITGSFRVTAGLTGSLLGTASFSLTSSRSITASISITESKVLTFNLGSIPTPITTGSKTTSVFYSPYSGSIQGFILTANTGSTTTLNIWKRNNALPTSSDSIIPSNKPQLINNQFTSSYNISTWNSLFSPNDIFLVDVEVNTSASYISLQLITEIYK